MEVALPKTVVGQACRHDDDGRTQHMICLIVSRFDLGGSKLSNTSGLWRISQGVINDIAAPIV